MVWAPDCGVMVEAPDVGHHEGSRRYSVTLDLYRGRVVPGNEGDGAV